MKLSFSKKTLKKISDKLRHHDTLTSEEEKNFSNYREEHNDILNAYQSIIRQRLTASKYKHVIFAQRLKRRPTIINKLSQRFLSMDLTRMHDIAGGRIIFPNLKLLYEFRKDFLRGQLRSKKYHQIQKGKYDYITIPNPNTGYRGIHDVFEEVSDDPIKAKIEIQYRTRVQHAWATTCEIWDSNFSDRAKFGLADKNIQLFFKLISEFFARMLEDSKFTTQSDIILYFKIVWLENKYHILSRLKGLNILRIVSRNLPKNRKVNKELLLLTKRIKETQLDFVIYEQIYQAMPAYSRQELLDTEDDSVLIKVANKKELKKAFNNYINDMSFFFNCWKRARHKFCKKHPLMSPLIEFCFPIYRKLTPKEKEIIEMGRGKNVTK